MNKKSPQALLDLPSNLQPPPAVILGQRGTDRMAVRVVIQGDEWNMIMNGS